MLKTAATPGDPTRPMVGIAVGVDSPVKVTVNLGQDIGGPSAGTAFALAIYDKLTPGALLDGKHVAGTGTIDATRPGRRDRRDPAEDRRRPGGRRHRVPGAGTELRGRPARGRDGIQLVKIDDPARGDRRSDGAGRRDLETFPACTPLTELPADALRPRWRSRST